MVEQTLTQASPTIFIALSLVCYCSTDPDTSFTYHFYCPQSCLLLWNRLWHKLHLPLCSQSCLLWRYRLWHKLHLPFSSPSVLSSSSFSSLFSSLSFSVLSFCFSSDDSSPDSAVGPEDRKPVRFGHTTLLTMQCSQKNPNFIIDHISTETKTCTR